ncbi:baseplate J family protein [Clostridium sp. CAG:768]|nr:baseplate J family protein [Clostridium sp. CAG:768]
MTELYNQTQDEITSELLANMPKKYQKTIGFPIWDFLRAIAIYIYEILKDIKTILSWQNVDNMTGEDLRRWVFQRRGIEWKPATKATTILTTTGTGFSLTAGQIVGESDTGLMFAVTEDFVSDTGIAEIPVECTTAGTIGNIPAGSITKIPVTIDGLSTIVNNQNATGGYDDESDDSLRERYYEDLQLPIVSGNKNHYRKWAREITGVKDAKVKALWNGDNTVKVIILDEENLIATDELVEEVQNYIDPLGDGWGEGNGEAPCGAYCTVAKALKKEVAISANIEIKTGFDFTTVKNNIEASLKSYFKEIAFSEDGIVSYTQISSYILKADGVKDHSGMLINGGIDNLKVQDTKTDTEVAVLGTLTLTEVQNVVNSVNQQTT